MNIKKFQTYFKKLNILPPDKLSIKFVEDLQKAHIKTFSFNSIAVLLEEPISLFIDDIMDKIVIKNYGGYCFEHNKLFHDVLESLGFNVRTLIAKVLNNQKINPPRTHRITLIEFENNQYIVDVGFGAFCPNIPLNINIADNQENYRFIEEQDSKDYQLEVLKEDGYFSLYKFDLSFYTKADCIMSNFYSSKHPNAVFVNNLVIALKSNDLVLSLRNDKYFKIKENNTEVIEINNSEILYFIIKDEFKIPITKEQTIKLFEFIKNKKKNKND